MRKLFRTSFLALAAAAISAGILFGCKKDEPTPSGGNGGGQTGPATVAVTGVSLTKTSITLKEGDSETLTATVTPTNATNKAVSWKSSDAATASVDNNGKVTAVKAGSATITVTTTDGSKTATCAVTVNAKQETPKEVTGIAIDPATLEIKEGLTAQLKIVFTPADASSDNIKWKSTNTEAATVDDSGLVTALKEGKTRIVATVDGTQIEAICEVTVTPDDALKGIEFTAAKVEVKVGATQALEIAYTPSYAANKNVTFSSSDASVATVDASGTVTAIKEGETTITATSEEGGFTATCTIVVTSAIVSGVYYNTEYDIFRDGENLGIRGTSGDCMDPEGNIYLPFQSSGWTCTMRKNGVDLFEFDTPSNAYMIMCAAGGGYCYFPYTFTYERNVAVMRVADDGSVEDIKIWDGPESYASRLRDIAVDKQGNAYIIGQFKDEYNVLNAWMFKVAKDKSVTTVKLSDGTKNWDGVSVAVADNGDVYCIANENNDLYLFKNGEKVSLLSDYFYEFAQYAELFIKGDDIYACVTERTGNEDETVVNVYKNGKSLFKIQQMQSTYANCIFVTSDDTVYLAGGSYDGNEYKYFIWKNDTVLYSANYRAIRNSLFVK